MSGHQTPAGASADDSRATPAGTTEAERAAQREQWALEWAAYKRQARGDLGRRRRAGRGTLPDGPGRIRRPPPDGGDAA